MFALFIEILQEFQIHPRGTFVDIFWSKGLQLDDKNPKSLSNTKIVILILIYDYNSYLKLSLKKSFKT